MVGVYSENEMGSDRKKKKYNFNEWDQFIK